MAVLFCVSLILPRGSPLTSKNNHLALDWLISISALSAPTAVKGLIENFITIQYMFSMHCSQLAKASQGVQWLHVY